MTPGRDVEGEVYAQLYGELAEPDEPASTRVIGDARREPRAREDSVLGPTRWQSIETVAASAAARLAETRIAAAARVARSRTAAEVRLGELRTAARAARAREGPRETVRSARRARAAAVATLSGARRVGGAGLAALGRARPRALSIGAVAVCVVVLGAIVGLSVGSGGDSAAERAASPQPPLDERSAEVLADQENAAREASAAREARHRRAQRKRRAARRRAAERASAKRVAAQPSSREGGAVQLVCVRGGGCYPEGTVVRRATPSDGGKVDQPSESERSPSVRTNVDESGSSGDGDSSDGDFDIEVNVPDVD